MKNQHSKTELSFQIGILKDQIDNLWRGSIMLNLLHTRINLSLIENSEMEYVLKGIESLINLNIEELENRVKFIEENINV